MAKIFTLLLLSSVMICCQSTGLEEETFEIDKSNVVDVSNFNLSAIADSCNYVKLETQSKSQIADVSDMLFVDNLLFVLNKIGEDNEVLVFDKDGLFLKKIGIMGYGPGEYIYIAAFGVNHFTKEVILLDPMNEKVHKYDYSGNYLSSIPTKEESSFVHKVRFLSDSRMLSIYSINSFSPVLVSESDIDLGNQKILYETDFKYEGGYFFAHNPITSDGNLFAPPLSSIIHQYNERKLFPALRISYKNNFIPTKSASQENDYSKLFISAIKNGFSPIQGISESKDFILVQQFYQTILWDKRSKNGLCINIDNAKPTANDLIFDSNCFVSGFDNGFVVLYPTDKIAGIQNYYESNSVNPNKKIKKLIRNFDISDNPYLCFYYFDNEIND